MISSNPTHAIGETCLDGRCHPLRLARKAALAETRVTLASPPHSNLIPSRTRTLASYARPSRCPFQDIPRAASLIRCLKVRKDDMSDNHIPPQRQRKQTERLRTNPDDGRETAERDRGFAEEHMPAEAARKRRKSPGDWQRKRVNSATRIARRSKPSDRGKNGCGKPLRRRASPARRRGALPRLRVRPWWMRCAPPPRP